MTSQELHNKHAQAYLDDLASAADQKWYGPPLPDKIRSESFEEVARLEGWTKMDMARFLHSIGAGDNEATRCGEEADEEAYGT